ncbi:MAG: PD-(D/E)XK nuclease family protein [Woeseiaceae bacterium]
MRRPSSYDLKHWTTDQRKKNVSIAIDSSYKRISDYFKEGLAESIKFHEKRKSEIILHNLIDFFANQSDHTIHSIEESMNFTHANLLLNLKVDRVNKSPDGKLHIIDFKTGKKIKILDNKGNIKSSQLFAYAAAIKTRHRINLIHIFITR